MTLNWDKDHAYFVSDRYPGRCYYCPRPEEEHMLHAFVRQVDGADRFYHAGKWYVPEAAVAALEAEGAR